MHATQRNRHAANLHSKRITPCEHPAIGKRHPRTCIKAKCLQSLRFFSNERGPVDRRDSRGRAKGKLIKCHALALP